MNDQNSITNFNFVDICAGIGGFHQAMTALGGKCVGAFEIDAPCITTYSKNFPDAPMLGDISKHDVEISENIDVLCAGFPCQPFSKAGKRLGFEDEARGKLFFDIMDLVDKHEEISFIMLENVRNLADQKEYWDAIVGQLEDRNFIITKDPLILSPSDFGIPQVRERVFILGIRVGHENSTLAEFDKIPHDSLNLDLVPCEPEAAFGILDETNVSNLYLKDNENEVLEAWDEFYKLFKDKNMPHPVWLSAMGFEEESQEVFYENCGLDQMPDWKSRFYRRNREFYENNKIEVNEWATKHCMHNRINIHKKFEWNCGKDVTDLKHGIIQIRQSGVRVKRPNYYPALVAMVNTPIVWDKAAKKYRYISIKEAAKLQSFDPSYSFVGDTKHAYKQLGNAINVTIVKELAKSLFALSENGGANVQKN